MLVKLLRYGRALTTMAAGCTLLVGCSGAANIAMPLEPVAQAPAPVRRAPGPIDEPGWKVAATADITPVESVDDSTDLVQYLGRVDSLLAEGRYDVAAEAIQRLMETTEFRDPSAPRQLALLSTQLALSGGAIQTYLRGGELVREAATGVEPVFLSQDQRLALVLAALMTGMHSVRDSEHHPYLKGLRALEHLP